MSVQIFCTNLSQCSYYFITNVYEDKSLAQCSQIGAQNNFQINLSYSSVLRRDMGKILADFAPTMIPSPKKEKLFEMVYK